MPKHLQSPTRINHLERSQQSGRQVIVARTGQYPLEFPAADKQAQPFEPFLSNSSPTRAVTSRSRCSAPASPFATFQFERQNDEFTSCDFRDFKLPNVLYQHHAGSQQKPCDWENPSRYSECARCRATEYPWHQAPPLSTSHCAAFSTKTDTACRTASGRSGLTNRAQDDARGNFAAEFLLQCGTSSCSALRE